MPVTREGPPAVVLTNTTPSGNIVIGTGGGSGQVLTSSGSNTTSWTSNVQAILVDGSGPVLGPVVNFSSGSNMSLAISSNTVIVNSTAGAAATSNTVTRTLGGQETVVTHSTTPATLQLDLGGGNWFDITLTTNVTVSFLNTPASGGISIVLILRQDGTGGRTVTWPGSVVWPDAVPPILSTAASAFDIITLMTDDGGATWMGSYDASGSPLVLGTETADPDAPTNGTWRLYAKVDGLYARSSNAILGPITPTVNSISHTSNTYSGAITLTTPGNTVGITSPASGTYAFTASGGGGGGGGATSLDELSDVAVSTSFPGSPSTNDLCFRTDRSLLYFYDGTRWLTLNLYEHHLASWSNITATQNEIPTAVWEDTYDVWIEDLVATMYAGSGLDATNYWRIDTYHWDGTTQGSVIATVNDQSGTNAAFIRKVATVDALMGTGIDAITAKLTKVNNPSTFYGGALYRYRLVG